MMAPDSGAARSSSSSTSPDPSRSRLTRSITRSAPTSASVICRIARVTVSHELHQCVAPQKLSLLCFAARMSRGRERERETSRVRVQGVEAPNGRTRCSRRVARLRRVGVVAGFFFVVSRARAYHGGVTEDAKIVVEGVGIGWSGVGRGARLDDRGARVDVPRACRGGDRHLVTHASNLVGIHRARLASAPRTSKRYRRFSSSFGGSSGGGGGVRACRAS